MSTGKYSTVRAGILVLVYAGLLALVFVLVFTTVRGIPVVAENGGKLKQNSESTHMDTNGIDINGAFSAIVVSFSGEVKVRRAGTDLWRLPFLGMRLTCGDRLETGPTGRIKLQGNHGERIVVDSRTRLTVGDNLPGNARRRIGLFSLQLFVGRVWVEVAKVVEAVQGLFRFSIITPSAFAGVRGTRFMVSVDTDLVTEVSVDEGRVEVIASQARLTVSAGHSIRVRPGGKPERPRKHGEKEKRGWEKHRHWLTEQWEEKESDEKELQEEVDGKPSHGENVGPGKTVEDNSEFGIAEQDPELNSTADDSDSKSVEHDSKRGNSAHNLKSESITDDSGSDGVGEESELAKGNKHSDKEDAVIDHRWGEKEEADEEDDKDEDGSAGKSGDFSASDDTDQDEDSDEDHGEERSEDGDKGDFPAKDPGQRDKHKRP